MKLMRNRIMLTIFPRFTRYMADYRVNGEIGKGAFGRVFRCTHRLDKGEYVIKMVPFNEEHREKTLREVLALRMSQHKNVVRYYQCWIEDGAVDASSSDSTADPPEKEIKDATLFIAMEHCPRTLKDILALPLENEKIHQFSKQLLEGLSHIHENGVVHLDIKPDNLFIDHSGNLKIGDFGFAAISNSREWGVNGSSSKGGDPVYEAPELKSNLNFSENVDTYSFGLVLLEMLSAPITTVFEKTELFQKAAGACVESFTGGGSKLPSDPEGYPFLFILELIELISQSLLTKSTLLSSDKTSVTVSQKARTWDEGVSSNFSTTSLKDLFKGKKVVIFGLPGAFTGVCSAKHVPSYKDNIQKFKSKGVDLVICVSVNDPYVMNGWAEKLQAKEVIEFYGDFDGSFHKSLDLSVDLTSALLGHRSHRWSAFVEDGKVKVLNVEKVPSEFEVSGGHHILGQI
ncbi:hypothetical protein Leryth_001869 [Lithospermum erythrorhizon]|nr:hypothetical protein Leryth_001869 [Lithospermum erythrorhizon]